jgi:hypothetical protein
MKAARMEFR